MKRRITQVVVVLVALCLATSALAFAPMGPPTAGLMKGQFRAGVDYAFSEQDIEAAWDDSPTEIFKDVQSNFIAANIGYGLSDDWEILARLGFANADFDEYEYQGETYSGYDFGGDYGFLFGFGTKYTWLKQESLNWGALFQMHWLNSEEEWEGVGWEESMELDIYEIQIAVGPTWKASEAVSIYGGPFVQLIGGDADWEEIDEGVYTESADLEQESLFGGYVGAQWDFSQNASVFGEFQLTGDAWAFGTGVGWKF